MLGAHLSLTVLEAPDRAHADTGELTQFELGEPSAQAHVAQAIGGGGRHDSSSCRGVGGLWAGYLASAP